MMCVIKAKSLLKIEMRAHRSELPKKDLQKGQSAEAIVISTATVILEVNATNLCIMPANCDG